jgi:hypothetical protein
MFALSHPVSVFSAKPLFAFYSTPSSLSAYFLFTLFSLLLSTRPPSNFTSTRILFNSLIMYSLFMLCFMEAIHEMCLLYFYVSVLFNLTCLMLLLQGFAASVVSYTMANCVSRLNWCFKFETVSSLCILKGEDRSFV